MTGCAGLCYSAGGSGTVAKREGGGLQNPESQVRVLLVPPTPNRFVSLWFGEISFVVGGRDTAHFLFLW